MNAEKGAATEGRYMIEVWGTDIGPGELLAVVSDALEANGTEYERARVSYTTRPNPPAKTEGAGS